MVIRDEMIKNSVVSKGDTAKINSLFNKAQSGEDITVAFLGGSITQGCNATEFENCYASRTYRWFKETFNNIKVKYINAGVGATDSLIGVHRVEEQVLAHNPDIVFIDFAVNDINSIYNKIAYESLIRRVLSKDKVPAIVEVFMSLDNGDNVQEQQINIGEKYNLPMISFRNTIYNEMINNRIKWEEVATDNVHPNDYGHFIISELLINFLQGIYGNLEESQVNEIELGDAIYGEKYIDGKILSNKNIETIKNQGFVNDEDGFQVFHNGWSFKGNENGQAELTIELEGKNIFLLYKKMVSETAGKFEVTIDNKLTKTIDTYFKDGWGDFSSTEPLVEDEKSSNHIITIKIKDELDYKEALIMGFLVS